MLESAELFFAFGVGFEFILFRKTGVLTNKNTPPDKTTGWNICFESTKSEAGLQFLLLGCMAKANVKGQLLFTDTSMTEGVILGPKGEATLKSLS